MVIGSDAVCAVSVYGFVGNSNVSPYKYIERTNLEMKLNGMNGLLKWANVIFSCEYLDDGAFWFFLDSSMNSCGYLNQVGFTAFAYVCFC